MKALSALGVLLICLGFNACRSTHSLSQTDADTLHTWISGRRFRFAADRVVPIGFRSRYLDPGYYLELRTDTVQADLPYFGRAYSAPIDPSRGGIQFISTHFSVDPQAERHGWLVLFRFRDQLNGVRQATLQVAEGGTATLQVTSDDRQPISFTGHLEALP